ncbi:MAG: hypothetical protein JJE25_04520 [Bacteroidia bacterium]|nr:hypothetical protein [Bacteroidia bacterium]
MAQRKSREIVAERTAYYRKKKKKVSQETAEDETGINFSRVEAGKQELQTGTLDGLSEYFRIPPAKLLKEKAKKNPPKPPPGKE